MRQVLAGVLLGLAAGGLVGFAVGRTGVESEHAQPPSDRPARPQETTGSAQDAPPVVPREPLRPRTRVAPPPPPPAERSRPPRDASPGADSPAEAPSEPARPSGEILHELAAALRAEAPLDSPLVRLAVELAASDLDPRPGLELVDLALSRSEGVGDAGHQIAFHLAGLLDPEAAFDAVEASLSGVAPRRVEIVLALAAAATASTRDTSALAARLLAHPEPDARSAGIALADEDTDLTGMLLDVARRDADDAVRAEAISTLMWGLESLDDDDRSGAGAEITSVILLAAREGRGDLRRTAVNWFPEIGPDAADTALTLLREGGLDEELLEYVLAPLLAAGRAEEAFAADRSAETIAAAAWWLQSAEFDADEIAPHLPLIRHLVRSGSVEACDAALDTLAWAGATAELDRLAGDRSLPGTTRVRAVTRLLGQWHDEEAETVEAERMALRWMRELLDPARSDATTRARLLRAFTWGDAGIADAGIRAEARGLVARVARNDPNGWVRDTAEEALTYLADEYD